MFLALGGIWGSSYLFIKVGVDAGLAPFTLVALRLAIGFALLALVVLAGREPLPREPRLYGHLLVVAVLNMAIPFSLIARAEQHVDSALAATFAAAIPLVVIPLAAVALRAERLSVNRAAGVLLGFVGVAVLVAPDVSRLGGSGAVDQLLLLAATVSYAAGAVYTRRFIHGLRPMIPAVFQVGFALLLVAIAALAAERPWEAAVRPEAIVAVVWLGLLGSGLAYLMFFHLIGRLGATRTSMVAYVMPLIGIVLGAAVLGESLDARLLAGGALVFGGILIVNLRLRAASPVRRAATTALR
jgi:drug/metabolite transporter (DMT)-like permease